MSSGDTDKVLKRNMSPEQIPTFVSRAAECTEMSPDVARLIGFADMSDAELERLLVNQNRKDDGYRIPKYS